MKKYIQRIGSMVIISILISSCNNDFLERYPLDEVSNETFWNSENDMKVYNNSLYELISGDDLRFSTLNSGHRNWWTDGFTDNIVFNNSSYIYYQRVRSGKYSVPTDPVMFGYTGWDFVRACNIGLANYNRIDAPQSIIDRYAGEARLFRGWFYADKVSKYGDVLWIGDELNIDSEMLYSDRTPREEVMENVLLDLNFACEKLPANWGDGNAPGRLNRWAALQVKSRVCLFEGTWQKYHGGTNSEFWLQEAANAAKELIENGPYHLYSTGDIMHDYNASHRATDLTGNPEILYWRKYVEGLATNHAVDNYTNTCGGATKNMVESYLCTDGLPITVSPLYKGDEVYENIFENRDPRLRQTVLYPEDRPYYDYRKGIPAPYPSLIGMQNGAQTNETGYHIIKFYEVGADLVAWNTATTPAIILRLGEALLNYAEAKAELNSITQDDLDISINKLRDRVGMPRLNLGNIPVDPLHIDEGVSPLIFEIRRERRVELYSEGFRYDDLRRWKQGKKLEQPDMGMRWDEATRARFDPEGNAKVKTSLINGIEYVDVYKGTDWANPVFDESKHYLWPIPLSIISQTPSTSQNPGWN